MYQIRTSLSIFILLSGILPVTSQVSSYPANMYGDSLHAPFYHGVASGDPLPDKVIIWTRITPLPLDFNPYTVNYQVATDSVFTNIITSGTVQTDSSSDWTVKKDITGLTANTFYYYRFDNGSGNYSVTGRTRTAPSGNVTDLRFAVFSCSSVYSGFFNAYDRVKNKADSLNAAIHLGDYIYDFVDAEEQVRVPSPYPVVPTSLEGWRDRHEYYLMDPDLRNAKASLPWICLWDNHDQDCGGSYTCQYQGGNEAFIEWLPIRVPDTSDQLKIYRTFSYGNLADIFVTDVLMYRHSDTLSTGEYNMLGDVQFNWLEQQLSNSTARWKLVPQQRMMGGWYTNGIPQWLLDILPNAGAVFDDGSWDGFPASKARLFNFVRTHFINNMIVLSGDAHVSIAQDLVEDPFNTSLYNDVTGMGSAGVEFLPTSISRGNMDESGAPISAFSLINALDQNANPQHMFTDLFNHGYGILHLMPDSSVAQFWYSHILQQDASDSLGAVLVVKDGENHWSRTSGYSSLIEPLSTGFTLFPNPTTGPITLSLKDAPEGALLLEVIDMMGTVHFSSLLSALNHGNLHTMDLSTLPAGLYFFRINGVKCKKFIKY